VGEATAGSSGSMTRGKKMTKKERREKPPRNYKNIRAMLGDEELFTPVNDDLLALLERLRNEWGSWMKVGEGARVSQRWLRYLRKGKFKTISYHTLDVMLLNLGVVGETQKLEWYTIDELVEEGIWNEQFKLGPHTGIATQFKPGNEDWKKAPKYHRDEEQPPDDSSTK
jgi:hypothetical protein